MPNYTYRCVACFNEHQVFHGMNDAPKVKCRVCHKATTKQFGSGGAVIFKGPGFYCNDVKKDWPGKI